MGPGDEGIFTEHGFLVYRIAILAAGGMPVVAPEKDLRTDVDAILAKVTPKTKIVFLANPNNPTGTYLPFDEVKRLHAGLPPHVVLVLDAAYAEYVRRNDYESGLELVATSENVVMTRTFSKIYGLANLRLGWMVAPPHIVDAVNRIRGPFNVNGPAMAAGIAAIQDEAHIAKAVEHNEKWLAWLTREIEALGLKVTPSVGNFLLIHFPKDAGRTAKDADAFLSGRGLILRRVDAYGLPDALRLTVGDEEANGLVVGGSARFLKAASMPERLGPPRETPLFERIALVGLGLIGSSIARAARHLNLARTIVAIDAERGGGRAGARARDRRRGDDRRGCGRDGCRSRHPLRAGRRLRQGRARPCARGSSPAASSPMWAR